jgi:hypothetical protein
MWLALRCDSFGNVYITPGHDLEKCALVFDSDALPCNQIGFAPTHEHFLRIDDCKNLVHCCQTAWRCARKISIEQNYTWLRDQRACMWGQHRNICFALLHLFYIEDQGSHACVLNEQILESDGSNYMLQQREQRHERGQHSHDYNTSNKKTKADW